MTDTASTYDDDTIAGYLSDLDRLMSEDPLSLSIDPLTPGGRKLSAIVTYHRNLRAEREAGKGKAVRARNKATAEGTPKLDISQLMRSMVQSTASGANIIKRRV